MTRYLRQLLLIAFLAGLLVICPASDREQDRGLLWIGNRDIALALDEQMGYRVYMRQGRGWLCMNQPDQEAPPQHLLIGKQAVTDFAWQPTSTRREKIATHWGIGERWTLRSLSLSVPLYQITTIECYEAYPQALILQTTYENLGQETLVIDRIDQNDLRLDASLIHVFSKPHDFWAFVGASREWRERIVFPVHSTADYDNYLGQLASGEGGGIPLLYVWNWRMGLALAHLETKPKLWYMPLRVDERGRVAISLQWREPVFLHPGERFVNLRTMLSVHQGDYYEPLRLYSQLMSAQGWQAAVPSAEAYEPVWCGWGYEFNFTWEEMLGVIPMLKELGIGWAVVDDRWFDAYGHWMPRRDTFPGGEEDLKQLVDAYHREGIRVQLWWYPLAVEDDKGAWASHAYTLSPIAADHPEWLILDEEGQRVRNNRNLAILCPALPEVQAYIVSLTERFIRDWGFDGHKLDNVYTVPPCYNPAHHHQRPEESVEALSEVYRLIREITKRIKPESVTLISPCGSTPNIYLLPYVDQPMMSDPFGSWQIRQRIKILKALMGDRAAVFADHVELTDTGDDFASLIGPGGVPGTKFVWPDDPRVEARVREEYYLLMEEKQADWGRWLNLYRQLMLPQGEYLNLYDTIYNAPEGHVVAKDGRLYYAFYTGRVGERYKGFIVLLGLEDGRRYRLRNYENGRDLGTVRGPAARLKADFQSHVLIEAIPD